MIYRETGNEIFWFIFYAFVNQQQDRGFKFRIPTNWKCKKVIDFEEAESDWYIEIGGDQSISSPPSLWPPGAAEPETGYLGALLKILCEKIFTCTTWNNNSVFL